MRDPDKSRTILELVRLVLKTNCNQIPKSSTRLSIHASQQGPLVHRIALEHPGQLTPEVVNEMARCECRIQDITRL